MCCRFRAVAGADLFVGIAQAYVPQNAGAGITERLAQNAGSRTLIEPAQNAANAVDLVDDRTGALR
jgi:hypothetical protein